MKALQKAIARTINALLGNPDARTATKYLSETQVVRATKRRIKGKLPKGSIDLVVTSGRPNFVARRYIKALKRAGEPFPVKKVHLSFTRP